MSVFSEDLWRGATSQPYPAPADLTALASVVAVLEHRRDAARDAHDQLHAIGTSLGAWQGEAAETFRGTVGKLLPNLQKATDSFGQAGEAVTAFRTGLLDLRARADTVRPRLHQAEVALNTARARLDPVLLVPDTTQERNALVAVLHEVQAIAADHARLVGVCVGRLENASEAGIRNSWSTFLPAHAKGLEKIAGLSGTIADVAGAVEMLALAASAAVTATGVGVVALPFLAGAAAVAKGVGIAAGLVRLVSDVGLASAQRSTQGRVSTAKKWDIGEDALSFGLSVVQPGGRLVSKVATSQILRQRTAAAKALDGSDLFGFLKADDAAEGIGRMNDVGGDLIGNAVDERIEDAGGAVRDGIAPEKRTATCP